MEQKANICTIQVPSAKNESVDDSFVEYNTRIKSFNA